MTRMARRLTGAAGPLLLAACALVHEAPLSPPTPGSQPEVFLARLAAEEAAVRSVRGLASIRYASPAGSGTVSQAIVVALPDRARLETLSPVGTTALVLTIQGEDLRVHSPLRHEYGAGRATRETLGRLCKVSVPPGVLLRLLAGLPPLPLRPGDPRSQVTMEGSAIRVDSVDGPYRQRLWAGADGFEVDRGELGDLSGPILRFQFGHRQPTEGLAFPFEIHIDEASVGARLILRYQTVQLNLPVEAGLFELPPPQDGQTRFLDLGDGRSP